MWKALTLIPVFSAIGLAQNDCPTELKCNFVCDCLHCSDEQNCGYNGRNFGCDFEDVAICGWKDKSDTAVYSWERRTRGDTLPDSGPSSDFTTGTSKGWFMAVTSVNSPSVALLVSPMMRQSSVTCRLRLRYFIWDSGHAGLDGRSLWGSVLRKDNQAAVVWRPEVTSFRGWREASIYLGRISQEFQFRLHSHRSQGRRGDIAIDELEFLDCSLPDPEKKCGVGSLQCARGGCVEASQICDGSDDCGDGTDEKNCGEYWSCDFEDGLCGWDLRTFSSLKWGRTTQQNLSSVPVDPWVGPGRDHSTNTASGSFLYLTSADNMKSDWSQFQSPVLEPTNSTHPCQMVLYTHQFGPRAGGLSILVVDTQIYPVWERGGELGDLWVKAVVEFNINVTFQIVLVGAVRDEHYGGLAVDSIRMSPGCRISNGSSPNATYPKPPQHPCTGTDLMCNFQANCPSAEDEDKCGDFSYKQGSAGWADASLGTQGWALHLVQNGSSKEEYLYVTEAPGQQLSEARTRTPPLGPSGPVCTLRLSYSLTGNSSRIGELSLSVIDKVLGTWSHLWAVSSVGSEEWVKQEVYIGARDHRFQLELGAKKLSPSAKIAVKDIQYINCYSEYFPATPEDLWCNFEEGLCGWYQDQTDNYDWTVLRGMDHTIGIGTSLVVDVWSTALWGLSGRLLSFPHLPTPAEHCLSFWYKLYGPQTGTLNVKVLSDDGVEVLLWTRSGAHGNTWHEGQCPIPPQHINFQLVFEAVRAGFDGQVAIDDVVVLARPCGAQSICSFEGQTCGYTSSGDSRWVHQNQVSGGVKPGPTTDHTLETEAGYYMIADTSVEVLPLGSMTNLTSPSRSAAPQTECVHFWYHMGGDKPGSLSVYVKPQKGERMKVFSDSLNQGDAWRHGKGNISSTEDWQLEFVVEGAGGTKTHIAIDDIIFLSHSCHQPDTKCDLERGLCGWSNTQALGTLDWELSSAEKEMHYPTPPYDHTLETEKGHFLFLPNSPRDTAGEEAWLLSPHLPPTLGTCLRFWVHKPTSHDGGFGVFRVSGNTQEQLLKLDQVNGVWKRYDINVTSKEEYQIAFQGIKGKIGVLALDDIQYTPGVDCAGQNTDSKPAPPPSDDKGGIAASIIVLLLLLITLAAVLVFYLRTRQRRGSQDSMKMAGSGGITNEAYDPSTADRVTVPQMNRQQDDRFEIDSEEREIH
ncbi:hypothetical protein MATL_G00087170 [Megalops atlanticus]|uniref:MAM domain-containing protein n=1 Tax=Megalops atlanticus TaxID=7932 RepID=A0A9D3Q3Z2_MEGAT|nr:hypothetical protein MATL_G00087170 [Megalops atlanticus]